MKRFFLMPAALLMLVACSNQPQETKEETASAAQTESAPTPMAYFGSKIDEAGAIELQEAVTKMGESDSLNVKLTGTVDKVCQVKGCWMTIPYGDMQSMRVSFKDYGFFVPKDIDGKNVVIEGTMYMEVTSVEDLKHYAEDEGLPESEIAMITSPESELTFVADGVVVKDYEVKTGAAVEEEQHHHHHGEGEDHEH